MTTREPIILVQGEPIAQQQARALIGWLGHDEAIQLLLGRGPAPGEDLSHVEAIFTQLSTAVSGRPQFNPSASILESAKSDWNLETRALDPLLHTAFAGLAGHSRA